MLPYFFQEPIPGQSQIILNEASSKHCIQVLRMQEGSKMLLTDGKGKKAEVEIIVPERKKCVVKILQITEENPRPVQLSLAIAFTKNKSRNEWLLEKITELGIEHIYPIITERSEKEKFNLERYNQILVSAMLQSQQCFLPQLHEPQKLNMFLKENKAKDIQKFIAHCIEDQEKKSYLNELKKEENSIVLIGPEGDFSPTEIEECLKSDFIPVTLGQNRLRTETAGMYVTTVFNAFHYG